MSLHCSVVSIRGSHLPNIPELLSRLDYRVVGSPMLCTTAHEAETALENDTGNRNVVRKAAYESDGWTHLFDPEMVVMTRDEKLSEFAQEGSTQIFAWVCEGISRSYGFKVFAPELRRDLLAAGGSIVTDGGDRLPEEREVDWSDADESDVLSLASQLGAPYDYLSIDRSYYIYTLDESHIPAPDLSALDNDQLPFRPEDIVARVVGRDPLQKKPWWKFW